jgi:hypothetical protein
MPVIKCSNDKWRIGNGQCIYETEEKATEVWQAILASGEYKANSSKISFDFDDTLSTARGQEIAKRIIREGKQVYIITRRNEYNSSEVYRMAEKLGIPKSKVFFTNGQYKWMTIKRLEIGTHYDNNQNEIELIKINTDCKAIKF